MSPTHAPRPRRSADADAPAPRRREATGWVFHGVMIPLALLWVLPMVFVLLIAVRSPSTTSPRNGLSAPAAVVHPRRRSARRGPTAASDGR